MGGRQGMRFSLPLRTGRESSCLIYVLLLTCIVRELECVENLGDLVLADSGAPLSNILAEKTILSI